MSRSLASRFSNTNPSITTALLSCDQISFYDKIAGRSVRVDVDNDGQYRLRQNVVTRTPDGFIFRQDVAKNGTMEYIIPAADMFGNKVELVPVDGQAHGCKKSNPGRLGLPSAADIITTYMSTFNTTREAITAACVNTNRALASMSIDFAIPDAYTKQTYSIMLTKASVYGAGVNVSYRGAGDTRAKVSFRNNGAGVKFTNTVFLDVFVIDATAGNEAVLIVATQKKTRLFDETAAFSSPLLGVELADVGDAVALDAATSGEDTSAFSGVLSETLNVNDYTKQANVSRIHRARKYDVVAEGGVRAFSISAEELALIGTIYVEDPFTTDPVTLTLPTANAMGAYFEGVFGEQFPPPVTFDLQVYPSAFVVSAGRQGHVELLVPAHGLNDGITEMHGSRSVAPDSVGIFRCTLMYNNTPLNYPVSPQNYFMTVTRLDTECVSTAFLTDAVATGVYSATTHRATGVINYTATINDGVAATFTFTNDAIRADSTVLVTFDRNPLGGGIPRIVVKSIADGVAAFEIVNTAGNGNMLNPSIHYRIF